MLAYIIRRMCVQFDNIFDDDDDDDDDDVEDDDEHDDEHDEDDDDSDDDNGDDDDDDHHHHHHHRLHLNCTSQRNHIPLLTTLHNKHPIGPMSKCLFSLYNA